MNLTIQLPVRVGLMDDDFFALKWNAALLTRDLRTTVCFEAENPVDLLCSLKKAPHIDTILIDVEYNNTNQLHLAELIRAIHRLQPHVTVVCLSQYGESEHLYAAITSGARGFLLKREIRMAIGSAVIKSGSVDFLITPGVLPVLGRLFPNTARPAELICPWQPNPGLSPTLSQVFTLRILYGMSAPLVAREMHLAPNTIEKYIQYAYQKLTNSWGDEEYLAGLNLANQPAEVQAFHQFNLPPKEENGDFA